MDTAFAGNSLRKRNGFESPCSGSGSELQSVQLRFRIIRAVHAAALIYSTCIGCIVAVLGVRYGIAHSGLRPMHLPKPTPPCLTPHHIYHGSPVSNITGDYQSFLKQRRKYQHFREVFRLIFYTCIHNGVKVVRLTNAGNIACKLEPIGRFTCLRRSVNS